MSVIAKNIEFAYDKKPILKNIDFNADSGFVSIIGPNGSGKTTLLKILSGIIEQGVVGSVEIYGEHLEKIDINRRAKIFASINQKQYFPFPFTCMEMVSLGRYPHRKDMSKYSDDDLDIIVEAMEKTHTIEFRDKLITEVSGGEQQRVVLASALCQKTKILFLDEAFSALDISHKAKSIKLLKDLTNSGNLLVVAVMHDLNIAYKYSDYIYILNDGKVVKKGLPREVMTKQVISDVFDVKVDLVEGKGIYIDV